MTAEKTIALTIHSFVGKVISLLLNMLSRFVIAFLPRNKWQFRIVLRMLLVCRVHFMFIAGCKKIQMSKYPVYNLNFKLPS